jgi:hypothetical protein
VAAVKGIDYRNMHTPYKNSRTKITAQPRNAVSRGKSMFREER